MLRIGLPPRQMATMDTLPWTIDGSRPQGSNNPYVDNNDHSADPKAVSHFALSSTKGHPQLRQNMEEYKTYTGREYVTGK